MEKEPNKAQNLLPKDFFKEFKSKEEFHSLPRSTTVILLKHRLMTRSFDDYVKNGILLNNKFNITGIIDIADVRTMIFNRDYYQKIIELIENKNIDAVERLPEYHTRTGEYLTIMKIVDQDWKIYVVTVYDSDEITQDPQVIQIFPQ